MSKRINVYISILLVFFVCQLHATDIFRLLKPSDTDDRYGKSIQEGPPYLRFGEVQQYYHYDNTVFLGYTDEILNVMSQWNNAGTVQFSHQTLTGLSIKVVSDHLSPGGSDIVANNNIINTSGSYVSLNGSFTWITDGQPDLTNDILDFETVLLHEMGHAHGLAHPSINDYLKTEVAPVMAGSDNSYFINHHAKILRQQDINGTQYLQYNTWVPDQCSTLEVAVNNSFNGTTVHVESACTLTTDISVDAGITIELLSGSSIFLNDQNITFDVGAIFNQNSKTITPRIMLLDGTTVRALCSDISSVISEASTGQKILIGSNTSLSENVTIPSGVTLELESGSSSSLTLDGKVITFSTGSILVKNDQIIDLSPKYRTV